MTNWIERVAIPRSLFLAWQAPDNAGDRRRWAVGMLEAREAGWRLRYLQAGAEFESHNPGKTFDDLLALGYQGYPAFPIRHQEHTEGVEEALMRRLPPRTRSDVLLYREQFRIPAELPLSNLELLAATEAKLPSDGFSVVNRLDPTQEACDLYLEVAGFRYYRDEAAEARIDIGVRVDLVPEPENPHDNKAVKVIARGRKIGNINRLQAPSFLQWLDSRRVTAEIERLNGKADKPRAFLFIRVRPL